MALDYITETNDGIALDGSYAGRAEAGPAGGNWWDGLVEGGSALLGSGLLETGLGLGVGNNEQGKLQDWGSGAKNELVDLGQQTIKDTQFKPVGVVSNTGNVTTDANGNIVSTLNQGQQDASNAALNSAQGLFGEAGVSVADRTQDIYGAAAAALQPQFQRQDAAVANGLYASGRSGFASAGFGGSSEQFSKNQSQEQSMLNAFFGARSQAGTEQASQAQAANSLLSSSMLGDGTMFNQHNSAINQANLQQTGQLAGANLNSQLVTSGIQTQLQSQMGAQDQRLGMLANNTGGQGASGTDWGGIAGAVGDVAGVVGDITGWF
jgi:hypothetical protein